MSARRIAAALKLTRQQHMMQLSHWCAINANPDRIATNKFHPYVSRVSQKKRRRLERQARR